MSYQFIYISASIALVLLFGTKKCIRTSQNLIKRNNKTFNNECKVGKLIQYIDVEITTIIPKRAKYTN